MTEASTGTRSRNPLGSGHEPDTSRAGGIAILIGSLASLVVGAMLVVGLLITWMNDKKELPAAASPPEPEPLRQAVASLNANQPQALSKFRQRESQQLSSYGWVDEEARVARIPVERAIEIVAQQGLPRWSAPSSAEPSTDSP